MVCVITSTWAAPEERTHGGGYRSTVVCFARRACDWVSPGCVSRANCQQKISVFQPECEKARALGCRTQGAETVATHGLCHVLNLGISRRLKHIWRWKAERSCVLHRGGLRLDLPRMRFQSKLPTADYLSMYSGQQVQMPECWDARPKAPKP